MPAGWSGSFRLLAEGPFEIEASWAAGATTSLRIRGLRDQPARVINPWPSRAVTIADAQSGESRVCAGERLEWQCKRDHWYTLSIVK
jgi:hypothetical protein